MDSPLNRLRPWQVESVRQSVAALATGNFLNGSDLGTGKTYCAVAAAAILGRPILAVCRIGARGTWPEVAAHFGFPSAQTVNREMLRTGRTAFGRWELGEHNHTTGKREKTFHWTIPPSTLLVVDEIHHDSGMDSLNSKVLRAAVRQGVKIIGLSGTAADDPRRMRAIGYMLGLHLDSNFYQWLYQYGATRESWTCGLTEAQLRKPKLLEERRREQMGRIHQDMIRRGRFVRLSKKDIPGFPRCVVEPTAIDFDSEQLKAILLEMRQELARLRAAGRRAGELEVIMRARQKAELLQVPGIVDEVNEGIAQGQSVALFVNFKETVRALAARLETDCVYTGDESAVVKERNRLRFQEDQSRVIILNADCGGESIGLHDVLGSYPRLGVVIPSFRAVTLNQILGRLPRDGSKSIPTYKILFARGTVEEAAYQACKARTERYAAFNGDVQFEDSDLAI